MAKKEEKTVESEDGKTADKKTDAKGSGAGKKALGSAADVRSAVNNLRKELLSLRIRKSSNDLTKTSEIRRVRKEIARLLTRLNSEFKNS